MPGVYGGEHQRLRKHLALEVEAGRAYCARCGWLIAPGSKWHLGHDHIRGGYLGPEHERCNLRDRNRRNNWKLRRPRRPRTSRSW
jgi:hypothetical protein